MRIITYTYYIYSIKYYTLFVNTIFEVFCCFVLFCNDKQN